MLNVGASKREDQELPVFHLPMIHKATDHFSPHNKIGEGGFGPVYKVIYSPFHIWIVGTCYTIYN